jgi:hypothetical protein
VNVSKFEIEMGTIKKLKIIILITSFLIFFSVTLRFTPLLRDKLTNCDFNIFLNLINKMIILKI